MYLYQMLKNHVKIDGKSPAFLYMGKTVSYGEFHRAIDDAAARLAPLVGRGEVATICMPNTPECVYCFYALNRIGAIAHMVHPLTPYNQLKKFMTAARSKLLITLSINLDKYARISEIAPVISVHPARALGGFVRALFNIKVKPYKGDMSGITDYDDLRKVPLPPEPTRPDTDTGVYLHSGGTGGEPKIIELGDSAINALAARGREALCKDDVAGMHMLAALPMFHGFGLAMCIHAALSHGCVSVLMPKFEPKTAVKLIKRGKLDFIIGVPSLFRALLRQKRFDGDALKNVFVGYVGGDCAPQDLLDEFNGRMEKAGARGRLFEGYGLTETVTVCAVNNYAHSRVKSMGRMLSDLDAIIVEPDGVTPLPVGEKGEIAVCGDTLMNGYLDNPEENAKTFFEYDGKRFVRTGDFGYMDADGFLYFVQRLKRIIKIAGISVYPKEIESCALEIDGVTGACAVDYDNNGKTAIALFLTGAPQDADAVRKKIENDLSRYAVPTIVESIDAIPVTPVMKADTRALTAMLEQRLKGESGDAN